ncbi:hypothetical protein [Gracilibacillus sp. JCM 18860]|uniref:hypothetical protein n=1 Tax=Gracilibacillus sp. JCM 18860 TaxID=1306159 RepID=UPI0006D0E171
MKKEKHQLSEEQVVEKIYFAHLAMERRDSQDKKIYLGNLARKRSVHQDILQTAPPHMLIKIDL